MTRSAVGRLGHSEGLVSSPQTVECRWGHHGACASGVDAEDGWCDCSCHASPNGNQGIRECVKCASSWHPPADAEWHHPWCDEAGVSGSPRGDEDCWGGAT